jgi:hypothetical protein
MKRTEFMSLYHPHPNPIEGEGKIGFPDGHQLTLGNRRNPIHLPLALKRCAEVYGAPFLRGAAREKA